MPFALLIVGIALLVSAIRGTHGDLFSLVAGEFQGPNNYLFWMVAILLIGAIGYIPKVKPFSVAFLALVMIVLVLTRGKPGSPTGGFFEKFTQALSSTQKAPASSTGVGSSVLPSLQNLSTIL